MKEYAVNLSLIGRDAVVNGSLDHDLPKKGRLYVVGDAHGDAHTTKLLDLFFRDVINREGGHVVFLGDYVNNGLNSIDTLFSVLRLQKDYPENVILLSGNHEFAETYYTAFYEFFCTHWNQWNKFSRKITPNFKKPSYHYGHIRLELFENYGWVKGEEEYAAFARWGRRLPFAASSRKGVFMAHSYGLGLERPVTISPGPNRTPMILKNLKYSVTRRGKSVKRPFTSKW